jgi:hypothetical protein
MPKLSAILLHFQHGALQPEIPFRGAVGVVDQHQVRIMFQALGLQFHGAAVLLHKFCEDEFQQLGAEGNPAKQIPGGDYIDAALVARDWSDGGQAGEPVLAGADDSERRLGRTKSMVVVMESASA